MSDYELETARGGNLKKELFAACERMGWKREEWKVDHERESSCSWTERGWTKDGALLIRDDDLTEGMAEELIRLARGLT